MNSAEKNYVADTTTDVTEANAIAVTVNASANATIDVSAMLIDGMQEESISAEDKIYSKVYDGTQLYKDRADYKKAVLKDENGKALTSEADSLIYTWYTAEIQEETDEEGKVIKKPVLEDECITYYDTTPVNSGLYALQVSYADAEHEYVAEPVCLYFRIDKQLLKVIPEGTPEAYDGTSSSDFIDNKTDNIDYKIYKIPGNDLTLTKDQLVEVPELAKGMSDLCYLRWFVMKGDNTNADIAEYTEVSSGYFKLGIPYKAGAKIVFNYSSYVMDYNRTNYSDNYTVIVEEKEQTEYTSETVPIVIKPMGTTELEISIDSSKLTTTEKVYDGKEFDISNDVANGLITVRKKNTDEMVPVTGDGAIALTYIWRYNGSYVAEKPINARTYTLYVKFEGNDNYQNTNEIIVGTFTITPRELTVTPVLHDTITAGLNVSSIENIEKVIDNSKVEITGYIEEDAEAFAYTDSIEEAKALQDVVPYVADADGNRYTSYLRTGKEYTAGYRTYYYNQLYLNASALKDGYTGNYKIVVTPVKFRTNKRGNSTVTAVNYNSIDTTRLKVTYEDLAVTVKPVEGIPYSYNAVVDENGDKLDGNYFVFEIDRPTEFCYDSNYSMKNNAVYKNSIEKAGGYVLNEGDSYIKVAFDATAPETGDNIRTFVIRWEDGYVESFTVDFTDAELESDLTAAVAPKTLAFNAVDSKMFVGECQQLDVKMTKHLVDDIICLNYEVVAGEDVANVNKSGYVTALKKGTATIAVYPVRYDKQGNATRLDYKQVTTKITVSDVTAPKVSKVYAYDDTIEVQYTKPDNGYRREIYVLEGKNLKPADFERKIAEMNQNVFEGVKVENVSEYYVSGVSAYNAATKKVTYKVSGLKPCTDYTVYVRNVSGIRTVENDSFVVSSAAGNVKACKTTKVQAEELEIYFKDNQPITWNETEYRSEVRLSEKTIQITARGWFEYKPENSAAEEYDLVGYELPLSSEQQKTYENSKLSFFAVSDTKYSTVKTGSYTQMIGDNYYIPSDIAKADKSGKIKLNGVGWVCIYAYDSISRQLSNPYWFYITSDVTKVTAKKMTIKVGEPQDIFNSLTFYDGKSKLKLGDEGAPEIKIELVSGEGIEITGSEIVATQAKKTAVVQVSLADNPNISTKVNITTKAMEPVKKLKATNITDTSCYITFTHSVDKYDSAISSDLAYKIEIKDARGDLVRSELIDINNSSVTMNTYESNYQKRSFAYSYYVSGLVGRSSYKISVTPVYDTETAKTATVKVKTTDVPAYRGKVLEDGVYGGMDIYHTAYDYNGSGRIEYGYFTSGNSYTFIASAYKPGDTRATDTLTWKSSDTKVATIKANADSYKATFKALKPGTTTIEVSSKLRKGVIARWLVNVKAVGVSGDEESGDFEDSYFDKYATTNVAELTEANPVIFTTDVDRYEYKIVKFTAPAYGKYTFCTEFTGSYGALYSYYYVKNADSFVYGSEGINWQSIGSRRYTSAPKTMEQGETVYIKTMGSFKMTVESEKYEKLTTTTPVQSTNSECIVFTVPEDNYYTFEATKADQSAVFTVNGVSKGTKYFCHEGNSYSDTAKLALYKGDVVTIELNNPSNDYSVSVKYRKAVPLTSAALDISGLKQGDEKWYTFKATEDGDYTFISTDATEQIKADFYESIMDASAVRTFAQGETATEEGAADNSKNFVDTVTLEKGETVAIRVYTESEAAVSAKISVTFKAAEAAPVREAAEIALDEIKDITVENGGEYLYTFTAPSYGLYIFKSDVTANAEGTDTHALRAYKCDDVNDTTPTLWAEADSYRANDFYKEVKLTAGQQVIFAVKPDGDDLLTADGAAVTTQAQISVTKVTAADLPEGEITLVKDNVGAAQWYKFKTTVDDTYTIKAENVSGETVVYYGASLVPSEEMNTLTDESSQTLKMGDVLYFKVVNPAADEAKLKLTVTGTKTEIENIPKEAFEVAGGETKTYKFTATKAARYKVSFTADAEDAALTVKYASSYASYSGGSLNTLANGQEVIISTVGNTYYFTVTNGSEDAENKVKVNLSVEAVNVIAIESEATATVEADGAQWFSYTVPATGRYDFAVTKAETNELYQNNVQYFRDILSIDTYTGLTEKWLKKDTVIYIKVNNKYAEDAVTVKVTIAPIEATDIAVGVAQEAALKKNESQWYLFTADEATFYTFAAEGAEDLKISSYYYYSTSDVQNSFYLNSSSTLYLEKNETILLKMTRTDTTEAESLTATLTVTKEEILTLEAEQDLTITAKSGERQYFRFIPPKTGYYAFRLKEVPDDVSISAGGDVYGLSDYYDVNSCTIADELLFYIETDFETTDETKDSTRTYKLYAEEAVTTEITMDSPADVSVEQYQRAWYTFEAPETGRYTFATDETAVGVRYEIYVNRTISNSANKTAAMPCEEYPLSKGDSVAIAVYYEANKTSTEETVPDNASFKLSVSKAAVTAMEGDETTVELEAGEYVWYSYTAAKTAEYTFSAELASIKVYRTITQTSSDTNKSMVAAGETVYVRVQNSSNTKQTITVAVTSVEPILLEFDTNTVVEFSEEEVTAGTTIKWVAFKVPSSGYYTFSKVDAEGTTTTVSYFDGLTYGSLSEEYFLVTGKTVYLRVVNKTDAAASVTVKATKGDKEFSSEVISLNQEMLTELQAGEYCYYEFKAPGSGYYVFYSTIVESATAHDSYGILYNSKLKELSYNDDGNGNRDFKIERWIEKDETVFLKVRGYSYKAVTCNVGVKAK